MPHCYLAQSRVGAERDASAVIYNVRNLLTDLKFAVEQRNAMPKSQPTVLGRKRPQLDIEIERLRLDTANPRLPEEIQGKKEAEVLEHLFQHFDLEEIADPMGLNGYFDEEPLVVVPQHIPKGLLPKPGEQESNAFREFIKNKSTEFTVVEGNRRLATAMILLDETLRKRFRIRAWPKLSVKVREDLKVLPAIVYPTRKEVLPYLGVRHITGNKKWDSYAKARYIADMIREGHSVKQIEEQVGDRAQSVRKSAIAYHMLREAKEDLDLSIEKAKQDFSLLLLAIGQRNMKFFLGWTKTVPGTDLLKSLKLEEIPLDSPVPDTHLENLGDLLSWLYGEGTKVLPVISDSRNITEYLSPVVASPRAVEYLKQTRNLIEAYEFTDGEEAMLRKLLRTANTKLEKALGVAHRHKKIPEVVDEAEKCLETASLIVKTVEE